MIFTFMLVCTYTDTFALTLSYWPRRLIILPIGRI